MVVHDGGGLFDAWINPLAWLEIEVRALDPRQPQPSLDDALKFMCAEGLDRGLDALIARYREITSDQPRVYAVPSEPTVVRRLVWPLRHAKASYMLGNYLGSIALCGLVSEMAALLLFDVHPFVADEGGGERRRMTEKGQGWLFGRTFERLGQERRIGVLRALGAIDDELMKLMEGVRKTRNHYLHLLSVGDEQIAADAVQMLSRTVSIVSQTIGQKIEDGRIKLRPALLRYLVERGSATVGERLPGDPGAQGDN